MASEAQPNTKPIAPNIFLGPRKNFFATTSNCAMDIEHRDRAHQKYSRLTNLENRSQLKNSVFRLIESERSKLLTAVGDGMQLNNDICFLKALANKNSSRWPYNNTSLVLKAVLHNALIASRHSASATPLSVPDDVRCSPSPTCSTF